MAFAGKIKCDFCDFIGDLVTTSGNGVLRVPDSWVSIHPMVVVHGMRGMKLSDPLYKSKEKIKDMVKTKVKSLHACPGCVNERGVFDMGMSLPAPIEKEVREENYMREETV